MIGGANDRLFGILSNCLGHPEWASNVQFAANSARVANRDKLERDIEAITSTKSTQHWLRVFEGTGLPYAKINDLKDTLEHEHVLARGMIVDIEHGACGPLKVLNSPVQYSETQPSIRRPPPLLGEHTDEVLSDFLGLQASRIKQLKEDKVVA